MVFLVTQGEMDYLALMVQQDVKEREVFQANQVWSLSYGGPFCECRLILGSEIFASWE